MVERIQCQGGKAIFGCDYCGCLYSYPYQAIACKEKHIKNKEFIELQVDSGGNVYEKGSERID